MSKTEFSLLPGHVKNEIIQDIIDYLNYDPEASSAILKVISLYPKPYELSPQVIGGKETGRFVRTIKLEKK
jgi:hypothetical protein